MQKTHRTMSPAGKGFMRGLVIAATLLTVSAVAQAQMGDPSQGPPMAMGAGRAVRGTVTAAAADHVTVKTEQGEVYNVVVTPNTQVRKGQDQIKLADVHVGDGIGAMGEIDPAKKTVHALYLLVVDAEQLRKAREAMGKTFITGTVTAIDEVKLTILRTDGVSQVIQVDEDTSFRKGGRGMQMVLGQNGGGAQGGGRGGSQGGGGRGGAAADSGGESVTLADVKVGDLVGGPGALKNGTFVPTQLAISDPAAQRQRRQRDPNATPGGGTNPAATSKPVRPEPK